MFSGFLCVCVFFVRLLEPIPVGGEQIVGQWPSFTTCWMCHSTIPSWCGQRLTHPGNSIKDTGGGYILKRWPKLWLTHTYWSEDAFPAPQVLQTLWWVRRVPLQALPPRDLTRRTGDCASSALTKGGALAAPAANAKSPHVRTIVCPFAASASTEDSDTPPHTSTYALPPLSHPLICSFFLIPFPVPKNTNVHVHCSK